MNPAIGEYVALLRQRWRWPMWGALVVVLAVIAVLLIMPTTHESRFTVFVRTPGDVSKVVDGGDSYARGRAQTYAAMAGNSVVAQRVISDLKLDMTAEELASGVQGSARPGTALIDVTVRTTGDADARQAATVYARELAAEVAEIESVPGALVPRAELVTVDEPTPPRRVVADGLPLFAVIGAAAILGAMLGVAGAVLVEVTRKRRVVDGYGDDDMSARHRASGMTGESI